MSDARRFLVGKGTPVLVIKDGASWVEDANWSKHTTEHDNEFCDDDLVADPQNPSDYKLARGADQWVARGYAALGYAAFKKDGWAMLVTPDWMTIEQGEGVNRKIFRGQHAK